MVERARCWLQVVCILMGVVAIGCGNSEKTHSSETAAEKSPHSSEHSALKEPNDHQSHGESTAKLALSLNGDEKWQMDAHTKAMFTRMVDRFEGFDASKAPQDELVGLGVSLGEDLQGLIAGCTMEGAAHDELHKYLVHYMPAVNALKTSGNLEDAKQVHGLLAVYPDYFE